ncbi:MAG: hypothetical protein AMJ38_02900 [Dehalococcoidia bacterium DG_22]|nr:MAG: hypothetical protein AMJ38_02900 [Dehalococcoidia bacterium DG_22]
MRKLRLVVSGLTVLAAFVLAAVMACGDGEGEVTPTPTAAEVEEQLQGMVLQLEDLPSGVIRAEEFFVTNEESAASSEDQEGRLAMLEEWGRILGYDVTYPASEEVMSQVGLLLVNSTASIYASEEGASASFADALQTARTTDWAALFGGAQEVEVEELASPGWVAEMLWLRITAKAAVGEQPQEETFANDVVIFRQGPARASLMVGWVMGRGSSDPMAPLAEAQAQRLKAALP